MGFINKDLEFRTIRFKYKNKETRLKRLAHLDIRD